jgi:hypothetical protein
MAEQFFEGSIAFGKITAIEVLSAYRNKSLLASLGIALVFIAIP